MKVEEFAVAFQPLSLRELYDVKRLLRAMIDEREAERRIGARPSEYSRAIDRVRAEHT